MSTKHRDDSFKTSTAFGNFAYHGKEDTRYLDGEVGTPFGFVSVYSQEGKNPLTRLDFIYRGRLHMRRYDRTFSHRGMVRIGHRFAKEIAKL